MIVPVKHPNGLRFLCALAAAFWISLVGLPRAEAEQRAERLDYLTSALWTGLVDVKVVDSHAYAVYWNGLRIFDLTDPRNPLPLGQIHLNGTGNGIDVFSHYAFIAAMTGGLFVVDIQDPANPVLVQTVETDGPAFSVVVRENVKTKGGGFIAFVAEGKKGMGIYGIADPPLTSEFLHRYNGLATTEGRVVDLYVSDDNKAYLADDVEGLEIVDVSVLRSPTLLGRLATAGSTDAVAVAVVGSGSYAFLGDGDSGLSVVDVSNPEFPLRISGYDGYNNLPYTQERPGEFAWDVRANSRYVYLLDRYSGVHILDIADVTNPVPTGTYDTEDWAYKFDLSGNSLYVADGWSDSLTILDVSDAASPVRLKTVSEADEINGISVDGTSAYVAANNGVWVVDIGNPDSPRLIGRIDTLSRGMGYPWKVFAQDGQVYVASREGGLVVADCSVIEACVDEARNAELIRSYPAFTEGETYGLFVKGTVIYLADGQNGVKVIDFSDRANPVRLYSIATRGVAINLA
ncbi:MAG: hypothetical protein HZA19_06865, partial [Nitrospirae bacterium]|nr:hypothetical protein [Nitrospirota bacterium]